MDWKRETKCDCPANVSSSTVCYVPHPKFLAVARHKRDFESAHIFLYQTVICPSVAFLTQYSSFQFVRVAMACTFWEVDH